MKGISVVKNCLRPESVPLILGKGPIQGLGDTTLTAEKECVINFSEQHENCYLYLHYN